MKHLQINSSVTEILDRELLESLAARQRPKTKAERQKPIYYALSTIGWFCQLISFVLASSGVLFQLVTNFKSSTGWILILLAFILLIVNEVLVYVSIREFHSERLDDKHINKSTVLMMAVCLCVSTPVTFYYTPYAVTMFAAAPVYLDIDLLKAEHNSIMDLDSVYIASQIAEASKMAEDIHNKNSYKGKTSRSARGTEQAYINQKLELESMLIKKRQENLSNKADAVASAEMENEIIRQKHENFCASFGGVLALVTVVAMFVLFLVRWYCENWKRLYVAEGRVKIKEQETPKETESKGKDKGQSKVKEVENQESIPIGFSAASATFNQKEGFIIKGTGRKRDRILVKVGDNLKPLTKGQLNNLINAQTGSERIKHLEQLKLKLG